MSKRNISFTIEDKELENALTNLMKDRIRETCLDNVEVVVSKKLENQITSKAQKIVKDNSESWELKSLCKQIVKEEIKNEIRSSWGDISKDIQKQIDASVKEALEEGRLQIFIDNAVQAEVQKYVSRIFNDLTSNKTKEEPKTDVNLI